MVAYDTVTAALADLKKRGYDLDFNIAFDKIQCAQTGVCLNPHEFEIVDFFRSLREPLPKRLLRGALRRLAPFRQRA